MTWETIVYILVATPALVIGLTMARAIIGGTNPEYDGLPHPMPTRWPGWYAVGFVGLGLVFLVYVWGLAQVTS
jgi:hypothetical protein